MRGMPASGPTGTVFFCGAPQLGYYTYVVDHNFNLINVSADPAKGRPVVACPWRAECIYRSLPKLLTHDGLWLLVSCQSRPS
jgi:hypothetical protein